MSEQAEHHSAVDERIPVRVEHFQLERLDESVLLYHPGLTKTMRLNETAAVLWELCDGEHSVGDIADMLADAYPDQAEVIAEDVSVAVRSLADEGAVRFV